MHGACDEPLRLLRRHLPHHFARSAHDHGEIRDLFSLGDQSPGADQAPATQADVTDFMNKFNVRYPIAFDPNLDVAKKYLQGGFPTIVLIGKNGKVLALNDGEIPSKNIAAALDAAIAGQPVKADFGLKQPPAGG